jgi:phage terminase large subunit
MIEWEFPEKLKFVFDKHRYKVVKGGRGGAKSWGFARALLLKGADVPLRTLCAREVQRSIKDSVHKLLSDQIQVLGLGQDYEVLQNEIRGRNGTEFIFTGLSNQTAESIKSYEGVDICWVEEAHKVSRRSWDILIPTIRKNDSEIWVSLNPELDTDETYVRFIENPPPDAMVVDMSWRDNPWFPETLKREREEFLRLVSRGLRTQDEYDNIWEGKPLSVVPGAIYTKELHKLIEDKRVRNVPYDPLLKVHTIWDLGWNDQTTIIFVQRLGGECRVIDYIEDSHKTYTDYVQMLEARKYRYGTDWLPHDGKAKNQQTGKSGKEILEAMGRKVEIVPNLTVEAGIKAARLVFPRCYFDKEKTGLLVNRLKRYHRSITKSTNQAGDPEHDENSHGADAFRYLSIIVDKIKNDDSQDFFRKVTHETRGIV